MTVCGFTILNFLGFFHSPVFFWRPVGVWHYSLRCPRSDCPPRYSQKAFLYRCGYLKTVRQICHMHGVDKQVICLLRDRTKGNTMAMVWRQVLESHCEEYLQRKDLIHYPPQPVQKSWEDHL
ncbi:hypothetical protein QQF64_030673 [Cirrhinus molitorella]|uniref:DUF6729 domain-containing protein n=1 Tax=Cirrhinus molitorella TaxID=172907 RepID=A0ABR3N4A2_9TELE